MTTVPRYENPDISHIGIECPENQTNQMTAPVLERQDEDVPPRSVIIDYENYRGDRARRRVIPLFLKYEATSWHGQCWTLTALDLEKQAVRSFAMASISEWTEITDG